MDDAELIAFKTDIDLRQYAAAQGYEVDKSDSWSGSTVMRNGADKIVIKRNGNSHYVYFSVRDDADHGTIVDFIQNRQQCTLGQVRLILRQWTGTAAPLLRFRPLVSASKDRLRVESDYRHMAEAPAHPYLLERCIPAGVLASARFAGRVRVDRRGNAVFPHFDQGGLCGYEIKNRGYTGFATGGEKGLWFSRTKPDDNSLVLAESAIDALSHAALFPDDRTRYASIGGKPNSKQPGLIRATVAKLPARAVVVTAFDADPAGRALVSMVRILLENFAAEDGRNDLTFWAHLPDIDGADWNDVLQHQRVSSLLPSIEVRKSFTASG